MISLTQKNNIIMKIYEKISNRQVNYIQYCLLYKMMEVLGVNTFSYDKKTNCYYSMNYSVTITNKRAYAKPFNNNNYLHIIKPPKNLTSI